MTQVTVELTHAIIVEATEKRIVIEINKQCYLNVLTTGFPHDHKVGERVPILSYLRMKDKPNG